MLTLLRIRNFAIIDELELEFQKGLNAITGETGAGKSIVLDALGLVLGNRANTDVIRHGSEEAQVEAVFEIGDNDQLQRKIESFGADATSGEVLIKRIINRAGKNRVFLNGELITLGQLTDVCENLVDLCSQHEHQSLSKPTFQLDLLDRYGGLTIDRRTVREYFSAYRSAIAELATLKGPAADASRTEDFIKFQLGEIVEFNTQPGEEETLVNEKKRLQNATQLVEAANHGLQFLGGENAGDGSDDAQTLLKKTIQRLERVADSDEQIHTIIEVVRRASVEIEDALDRLNSYASSIEFDSERLETVEARLSKWISLKKKYGATYEEFAKTKAELEYELANFSQRQERIDELEKNLSEMRKNYETAAKKLSTKRKKISETLADTIESELRELKMDGVQFKVEFQLLEESAWTAEGIDRLQFLFSANPGEPLKPLSRVASGGELSRVLLAIRRTIADRGGIGVYVFDEIDAGIGGQTAMVVGKKLRSVAKHNQIICITHLPQVAAFANAHYSVTKKSTKGRTSSQILKLSTEERVAELTRMLGGDATSEKSRAHAKELFKSAQVNP